MNTESNEPKTAQQINEPQVGFAEQLAAKSFERARAEHANEISNLRAKLTALENTNRRIEHEKIRLDARLGEKQQQIDRQAAIFSAIEAALGRDVLPDQAVEAIRELKARLEKAERIVAAAKNVAKYLDVLPNCPCADCTSGRELQKLLSE